MNIELISISKNTEVNAIKVFDFTPNFFLKLSKSDFSQIGDSVTKQLVVEGEIVDMKLVEMSQFIRDTIIRFLEKMYVDLSFESFEKLGSSPSKEEFQEYTCDLKELNQLIIYLRETEYTHLKRV
ncbi:MULTISPECIES: hypothetical protein [unclassified Acinetobacter]|uniref:hypothetical protein n=1 Tax=unclassified Acinetobacter TaxID=196816 RepID=UPI0015D2F477|nr:MULTISPECIES: hypothetical protein [unclassified Acinetobacter]UNW06314.1 hypothetical protein MOV98_11990 [Acinetobacter variabilis]